LSQFEWRSLRLQESLAWTVLKHEAEVDVHYVALSCQHDIAIVTVSYTENVAENTVGCKRIYKVLPSLNKVRAVVPLIKLL
jgi:hypothetical protein